MFDDDILKNTTKEARALWSPNLGLEASIGITYITQTSFHVKSVEACAQGLGEFTMLKFFPNDKFHELSESK